MERRGDMRRIIVGLVLLVCLAVFVGSASAGTYLVYDSGGAQNGIQAAMTSLGFTFDVRNAATPVTAADLASHAALIIGWSGPPGIDMSGLSATVLGTGITGNKLLTGHDPDWHTVDNNNAAAATFMTRAVLFAGGSPGNCGILAFPVYAANPFPYLPSAWEIIATGQLGNDQITAITADGVSSGLYEGLSLASLSNWYQSYHAVFTAFGADLTAFELGEGNAIVTIGKTVTPISAPEPSTMLLLGSGLVGLVGYGRRRMTK
jgi:hypothetical protein